MHKIIQNQGGVHYNGPAGNLTTPWGKNRAQDWLTHFLSFGTVLRQKHHSHHHSHSEVSLTHSLVKNKIKKKEPSRKKIARRCNSFSVCKLSVSFLQILSGSFTSQIWNQQKSTPKQRDQVNTFAADSHINEHKISLSTHTVKICTCSLHSYETLSFTQKCGSVQSWLSLPSQKQNCTLSWRNRWFCRVLGPMVFTYKHWMSVVSFQISFGESMTIMKLLRVVLLST